MEVVLLEKIKNLGQIGDVVNVKRGHGRNFLIKFGKALKASKENISLVNKKKASRTIFSSCWPSRKLSSHLRIVF